MDKTLVLLAAGKGSRFGGLKQLHAFQPQNATLAEFAIYDALKAGFNHFVAIVSEETHTYFQNIFKKLNLQNCSECVLQGNAYVPPKLQTKRQKPWGTGHAFLCACHAINSPFVIINGDDFYGPSAYRLAADFLDKEQHSFALVGYPLGKTLSECGSVSRALCSVQNHQVISLHEYLNIKETAGQITSIHNEKSTLLDANSIVSMNFWILQTSILKHIESSWESFLYNLENSETQEFYLPMAIQNIAKENNISIQLIENNTTEQWLGITYANDVPWVQENLNKMTRAGLYPQIF